LASDGIIRPSPDVKGYPYFMIDFEAKAAAQYFALVLKTAAP
jgi:hypothetical protein